MSGRLSVAGICELLLGRLDVGESAPPADHLVSSAVLLPLLPLAGSGGEAALLYMRRANGLPDHAGQVSFPGGTREPGDESLFATAVRESAEEVGADAALVKIVGALASVSTLEKYWIQPFVSAWPAGEYAPLSLAEVDSVFRVPVAWLLAADAFEDVLVDSRGGHLRVPAFVFEGEVIWGATRRITLDFLARLRAALDAGSV